VFGALILSTPAGANPPSSSYMTPDLVPGDRYSLVAGIAMIFRSQGRPPRILRLGGAAQTQVLASTCKDIRIRTSFINEGDGSKPGISGTDIENVDPNLMVRIMNGKPAPKLGANGFLPRSFYGAIPATLSVGTTWRSQVEQSTWNPAGTQRFKVMFVDPPSGMLTLAFAGEGAGSNGFDRRGISLPEGSSNVVGKVVPNGIARWHGIITIQHGLIEMQNEVVERDVDLVLPDSTIRGHEHVVFVSGRDS